MWLKKQWTLFFFFSPWQALYVTSRNAKGLVTHPAKQDIQNWPPGFTGSVILLSFLFLLFRQVPTASVTIEGASALNRVRWAQAGKEVAVGDSEGRIWIYDVGEVLLLFGLFWFFLKKLGSWRMLHPSLRKDHVL